jgi:tetratricopeptide (TPR) repeat protein
LSGHYDETALQDYLDDPDAYPARELLESHVAGCAECRRLLDELRAFDAALSSEALWELAAGAVDEPPESVRVLTDLLAREDSEAERTLAPLMTSPVIFRRANVASRPTLRTAGAVRTLCAESRSLREKQPMHALVLADAAIAISDQLPNVRYPQTLIDELRGDAWHERANVLRYLGRHSEALDALDIAGRAYAASPVAAYWTAVVDYSRAVVFLEVERLDEAMKLARKSARVFRQFGEDERFVHAKIVEGAVLFDRNRYRDARELFIRLITPTREAGDATTLARLYLNIANCQLRLNELASADSYFARALSLYEALGLETERIRTRWNIGCLRLASGEIADGLARLREARREFEQLGARTDAALVTLDIAEALLAGGSVEGAREAAELCGGLVQSFTAVGMTGNALTALAFLQESFATGAATPQLVRHVRQYLEAHPDHEGTPFVPPTPN